MKLTLLVVICLFSSHLVLGQLEIKENTSARDLINDLLGDTEDIEVSNVTIRGGKKAYGLFKSELKHHDFFNQGIILTNGLVANAKGPNNDSKKSAKVNFKSDPDINKISEHKGCYDTILFEFDLISKSDEIQFRYFFASEEYPEYVNKNVNDVFIFLVTNLTTKTSENIAILNGDKNIPITVDHINLETNSDYYVANSPWNAAFLRENSEHPKNVELSRTYQYDGFTKVLVATAKVTPNTKYHLKLGISDVGDQLYDSAIFLESNSLKSTGKKVALENPLADLKTTISIDYNIEFTLASSQIIGAYSFEQLDEIIGYLKNDPMLTIGIIGHTDSTGSVEYNDDLSIKRANAVMQYFITNQIDLNRVSTQGMGEKEPKSTIHSENRRVEIVFSKMK